MRASEIEFRAPTTADMAVLIENMRQADRDELDCIPNYTSRYSAVYDSVRLSDPDFLFAARVCDHLICIGGVSVSGNPWLVGTDLLDSYGFRLHAEARLRVALMLERYPVLFNWVDCRNLKTIRWLRRLGFVFLQTAEFKPGLLMVKFEMRAG